MTKERWRKLGRTLISVYVLAMVSPAMAAPPPEVDPDLRLLELRRAIVKAQKEADEAHARLEALCRQRGNPLETCAPKQVRASTGRAGWARELIVAIEGNWLRPDIPASDASGCVAEMTLTPDGQVVNVVFDPPCANASVQASIERAIRVTSPLPLPADPADFTPTVRARFTARDWPSRSD